jgi:hypothetical protein
MKWIPYAPILPGFYWVKCKGITSGKEYIQVAKVYSSNPSYQNPNTVYVEGENFGINSCTINITHYSDSPIPFPEELKGN